MKRAIVTGGAGFIGSHITDALLESGIEVVVIDNESSDCHEAFYWNDKAENHKLNICDYDDISPLFEGVDTVFHLAAEARIQPAIKNPLLAVRVNVLGTCNVLQAAHTRGVRRFIYSSTSSAYGRENLPPQSEDMVKDCLNPYSVSKTCGEELCKMYYSLYGLETVSFRYFNVYGERQPTKGQYAPVVGLFAKQKEQGLPCTIVGDGLQRRDYTYVIDVVKANILAATTDNDSVLGELFNIGTGKNYNIFDLVGMIDNQHIFIPPRPAESRETLADITKVTSLLGWQPETTLEEWIKKSRNI
tara:strand:- start:161 stop:1066 length:906 start_codon:yes stop_codon:yes gene_type:complete